MERYISQFRNVKQTYELTITQLKCPPQCISCDFLKYFMASLSL